jgi:hypothetical protein
VGTPSLGSFRQLELQRSMACARGRAGGAPKQAAEAKPSSRGDARAAGRARTGGAKGPDPLTVNAQRLRLRLGEELLV